MKQYTNSDQTAKPIELGFERPFRNEYLHIVEEYGYAVNKERNFSIGELLEIIDSKVTLEIDKLGARWMVSVLIFDFTGTELINCLFDACVKLKAEGVI